MTNTEKMAKAHDKNRTNNRVNYRMLWIKDNFIYRAGQLGADVDRIHDDGTYHIPNNESNGWFIFTEGVDFVKVKCEIVTTHTETYTVEA